MGLDAGFVGDFVRDLAGDTDFARGDEAFAVSPIVTVVFKNIRKSRGLLQLSRIYCRT